MTRSESSSRGQIVSGIIRLGELIERRARRQPEATAFIFEEKRVTYAALLLRVNAIHNSLADAGVSAGDRVACHVENHPDLVASLLATARIGAVLAPLGSALTQPEVTGLLNVLGARVLLVEASSDSHAEVFQGTRVISFRSIPAEADDHPPVRPLEDPDETALIMFTSGSSGTPKGVELTHESLFFNVVNNLLGLDFASDDIVIVNTPLSHAAALATLAACVLHKGGTLVIERKFNAERTLSLIARFGVTAFFAVPATLTLLERAAGFDPASLSSLRWVLGGGAAFAPEQIERWAGYGIPVISSFGMTEAGPSVSFSRRSEASVNPRASGKPGLLTEVAIRDPDAGGVGEITVRGPHTASRYWRSPTESERAFRAGGWLWTGDRGYVDDDGNLCVTGRSKDLIISGGENIDPVEVEHAVAQFPGVVEVVVTGRPDELWGERVTAVLVADREIELDELRQFLSGLIAGFKMPRALEFRESLPRNAIGKLVRASV